MTIQMTHRQGQALARFIATLRPDWDVPGIEHSLGKARGVAPVNELAIAAIKAACIPTNRSPSVIGLEGPHWRGAEVTPHIEAPGRDERCSVCSMHRDRCRDSWRTDHDFISAADAAKAKRGPEVHEIAGALKAEIQPTRTPATKATPSSAGSERVAAIRQQLAPKEDDVTATKQAEREAARAADRAARDERESA